MELHEDEQGQYFILPSHSYGLGVALEALHVPENISYCVLVKYLCPSRLHRKLNPS